MLEKTEKAFDLEKVGLEMLRERIRKALKHFRDDNKIQWTQIPMEQPLWERLDSYVDKQIPRKLNYKTYEQNREIFTTDREYDFKCPSCGNKETIFDISGTSLNYCGKCGQRLDWD